MRALRVLRRLSVGAVAVCACVLALGAAGCHSYKYYDIHASFDPTGSPGFTKASAFSVYICQVTVTGADSATFDLPRGTSEQRCPNMIPTAPDPLDAGSFEFTTFADSGNLTFTLDAFQNPSRTADCLVGVGVLTLPVNSTVTVTGELSIKRQNNTCVDIGQNQGDANAPVD